MSLRRFVALTSLSVFMAAACQKGEPQRAASQPAPETKTVAPAPVVPPPPPQTSMGTLVKSELSPKTKVRIQYLTTSGLKSGVEEQKAGKGKTFVVLHFEGKKPQPKKEESGLVTLQAGDDGKLQKKDNAATGEPKLWLTDAAGKKYSDWSSFWEKEQGTIAFEVPEGTTGLVFHDGDQHEFPIKPEAAAAAAPQGTSGSSPAPARP